MALGLDKEGRAYIAKLVNDGAKGDYVRKAIKHRVRSSDWDYDKNLEFLQWLRRKRYDESAEFLAKYLDG
jgi:hypothetical protein